MSLSPLLGVLILGVGFEAAPVSPPEPRASQVDLIPPPRDFFCGEPAGARVVLPDRASGV